MSNLVDRPHGLHQCTNQRGSATRYHEMVVLYHFMFLILCSFLLLVYQHGLQSVVRCLLGNRLYLQIFLGILDT